MTTKRASTKSRPRSARLASTPNKGRKAVNLALQGGGAHGAFTWGVLDYLLEDGRVDFDGVCATSAGAMNGAILVQGLINGGPEGGRELLEKFWRAISQSASNSPLQQTPFDRIFGGWKLDWSPSYLMFDILTRLWSPYQFNPAGINPLREILLEFVDFDQLRRHETVKLFVTATNVRSGKIRVFSAKEMSVDAVLASACLPFLFQAVEVDGEHYWDGGYMGNPAIYPLIYHCESRDVVIVHVNPIHRDDLPVTAGEIMNRINEISFNSSLMREMRAIEFVTRMIEDRIIDGKKLKKMLIHSIEAEDVMSQLGVSSKLNPDWEFLTHLRDVGRARAKLWLESRFDRVGKESTVDIRDLYL